MKVSLGKGYCVKIDTYNHTLVRIYDSEGKEKEKFVGYFPNMEHALRGAILHCAGEDECVVDFEEYLKKLKYFWEEVKNA